MEKEKENNYAFIDGGNFYISVRLLTGLTKLNRGIH